MNRSESIIKAQEARRALIASGGLSLRKSPSNLCVDESLKGIPDQFRSLYARIYAGSPSKALRIKAKCLDCCGFQRSEVTRCPVRKCALWAIRPYQTVKEQQHED